jgi:hypothetical protein
MLLRLKFTKEHVLKSIDKGNSPQQRFKYRKKEFLEQISRKSLDIIGVFSNESMVMLGK